MKHSVSEEGGETVMEGGAAASGGAAAWWRRRHGAPVPLDSECKARQLRLLRPCAAPHMRSFYLAMLSHFVAVFATFAAAPLLPVIRSNLNLDKAQISTAGIAAVAGTILARVAMGGVCDRWGPRYGAASLNLLTAAASFGMAAVESAGGYLAARFFIGFSLAAFVACQFWCSVMFSPRIVGTANAVAAGWGNSAGGFVQLLMPLLLKGMERSQPEFVAWRACYLVVGWLQVVVGMLVLWFGQDLPHGNYAALRRMGSLPPPNTGREYLVAVRNYRTWVLTALYAFSFGVELTMNNVFAQYVYDNFGTSLTAAGALASVFGLTNIVSRPAGGWLSDAAAHRFGMRGRLWVLFLLQASAAAFCCGLSRMGGSLGGTMAMAVCMGVTETAAAGSTFGIVPFVTKRGLGAANGIIGSGSSAGSILLQGLFFTGSSVDWSQGFLRMGLTSLGASFLAFTIYFPMWGGMVPCSCWASQWTDAATEEQYYCRDFTPAEQQLGLHRSVLNFAAESRSQRGISSKRVAGSSLSLQLPTADGGEASGREANGGGSAAGASASAPGTGRLSKEAQ